MKKKKLDKICLIKKKKIRELNHLIEITRRKVNQWTGTDTFRTTQCGHMNISGYFFLRWMFLLIQLRPSLTPSPLIAEHACICHERSRIVCKLRPSAISLARAEFIRSCLLANMSTGTPMSFSSANSSDNSYQIQKNINKPNFFQIFKRTYFSSFIKTLSVRAIYDIDLQTINWNTLEQKHSKTAWFKNFAILPKRRCFQNNSSSRVESFADLRCPTRSTWIPRTEHFWC